MSAPDEFFAHVFGDTATRIVTTTEIAPKCTVGIQRSGKPKNDLSGFDITSRRVVLTVGGQSYALDAEIAQDIGTALERAAIDIYREEER